MVEEEEEIRRLMMFRWMLAKILVYAGTGWLFLHAQFPILDQYLEQALEYCPHFRVHDAQVLQFEVKARLASVPLPVEVRASLYPLPIVTRLGPQWLNSSIMFHFPFPGTFRAWSDYYRKVAETHHWMKEERALWIRREFRIRYFQFYYYTRVVQILSEQIELLETQKKLLEARALGEEFILDDYLRLDAEIRRLTGLQEQMEEMRKSLQIALNVLLGVPDTLHPIQLPDTLPIPPMDSFPEFRKHPRYVTVQKEVEALEVKKKAIRRKNLPFLGAGLGYALIGEGGRDALAFPSIRLIIPFPTQTRYELEDVSYEQLKLQYTGVLVLDELVEEYARAWAQYEAGRKRYVQHWEAIRNLQQARHLLWSEFFGGDASLTDVLDLERQILQEQLQQEEARLLALTGFAFLLYLAGK